VAAKGRTTDNPQARRRNAADEAPPDEIFQPRARLDRPSLLVLLNLLTVVLLFVSFAPYDCWYIAYVALVPWGLALAGGTMRRWTILAAYLGGLLFWATGLYWLLWVTPWGIGYAALVLYLSLYWLLAGLILRATLRRHWPAWICLPVVWVALEYARAHAISGFPWFFLAHSQYTRAGLIQIADASGQYGVSFFVAMVNGALIDLLCAPLFRRARGGQARLRKGIVVGVVATIATGAGLLLYGHWRLGQQTMRTGPVIGIVQCAFPVTLCGGTADPNTIFEDHLAATEAFVGEDVDLVIWPESVLPWGMNPELLNLLEGRDGEEIERLREQARRLGELSRRLGCPILAGGITQHVNPDPLNEDDVWLIRNSALWFDGSSRASRLYSKVHLVPFGEYVPFKYGWPWLHKLLRRFVPPEMYQLDPGRRFTVFELDAEAGQSWRLVVPICYEGTFARVCRDMVMRRGRKVAQIIVNISNDGWFVYRVGQGRYRGSNEHRQHLAAYCFRAVENRTPVVRAVNTGISGSIDSDGRIAALLRRYGVTTMVSGTLLLDGARGADGELQPGHGPKVLVDERRSAYSFVGDVFAQAVSVVGGGLIIGLIASARQRRKGKRGDT